MGLIARSTGLELPIGSCGLVARSSGLCLPLSCGLPLLQLPVLLGFVRHCRVDFHFFKPKQAQSD